MLTRNKKLKDYGIPSEDMIKQYNEMLHKNWDAASEEQRARIAQLKAQTDKLTGNNQEIEDLDDIEGEIYGNSE